MRAPTIFALIVCALWLWLVWTGGDLLMNVSSQNAPGYPNSGQIIYYAVFPTAVAILIAASIVFFNRVKQSRVGLTVVAMLALMLLPAFLMSYTGGV